jgi:iduronate 2-sulfatase|tara:strand:- start:106 stop:321 length:216 start_codon:yes stop_codon:yes gene_type:complete
MAHSFFNATTGKVWPLDVHTPLDDDVARTARHAYYASVTWMDHQVGRILDELEALGLAENTLVVLHGDHGA